MSDQTQPPNPTELQQWDEQWDELVHDLDREFVLYKPLRHQMGKILYQIKVHLQKHGLDKGRSGRWKPMLDARKIPVSTANDWVRQYEEEAGIPAADRFLKPPVKYEKKSAESVLLAQSDAFIEFSEEPDKTKREAVEAVFVLTAEEKYAFISAIAKLKPERATQLMYQAVVIAE